MRIYTVMVVALLTLSACAAQSSASKASIGRSEPAPIQASAQALPANVVVSTNEPFWQGRVQGQVLQLKGLEGERTLTVDDHQLLPDARLVSAHDARGRVRMRITPKPCQDSMSGVEFPYTGNIAFDDGDDIIGCARPADATPAADQ